MRQRKITTISLAIFHRYLTGTDIEILSIKNLKNIDSEEIEK